MKVFFSYRFKILGMILFGFSIILTLIYFIYGLRIIFPVFAVYSSYLETKYLTTFKTNIGDELILLSMLSGLCLIAFSKEKNENEYLDRSLDFLRYKALRKTIAVYLMWIFFSIIFVYGNGFTAILILNIGFPILLYIIIFYYLKRKLKKPADLNT